MAAGSIKRTLAVALVLAAGGLAGCGGDDEPTVATEATPEATATQEPAAPAGGGEQIEVAAVEGADGLGWDPADLSAPAGEVTITMDNPDGNEMPHTVSIEGNGVDASGEAVEAGETSTVSAELEAGEYTFYCPVGQHRENGMEGTLTVE